MINQKSNATKSSNLTKAIIPVASSVLFEVVLGRRRDSKANWMRSAWFSGSLGDLSYEVHCWMVTTCHNSKPLRCTRFVASWGASACAERSQHVLTLLRLPLECLTPSLKKTCQSQKRLILYKHVAYDSIYVNMDQYSIGPDSLLVLVPTCVNGQTPISPIIISWLSAKRKNM